jgi:hypothetical protein
MKRSSLFLTLLLLISWTVSYAQTGKPQKDTIKCYGLTELRYIAATMVEARACDTLLDNSRKLLSNRDSMIVEKNIEISKQSSQLVLKDKIIEAKDKEIVDLNLDLTTANNHKKLLAIGWGSTSFVLTAFLIYFAVR